MILVYYGWVDANGWPAGLAAVAVAGELIYTLNDKSKAEAHPPDREPLRSSCAVRAQRGERVDLPMPTHADGGPHGDGYSWGYAGTGPTAAAIAILGHASGFAGRTRSISSLTERPRSMAEDLALAGLDPHEFRGAFVERQPQDGDLVVLAADVDAWVRANIGRSPS